MGDGNPDIKKHAIPFGPNNDPRAAAKKSKPWSIRRAIRRIAQGKVQLGKKVTDEDIARILGIPPGGEMTMVEATALAKFKAAIGGDVKAMQQLEDSLDGKLVERKVEVSMTLEQLVSGQLEDQSGDEDDE